MIGQESREKAWERDLDEALADFRRGGLDQREELGEDFEHRRCRQVMHQQLRKVPLPSQVVQHLHKKTFALASDPIHFGKLEAAGTFLSSPGIN